MAMSDTAGAMTRTWAQIRLLRESPIGMVGGQALDLASVAPGTGGAPPPPLDQESLATMHGKKTGALIRGSAVAGAIMGGGDDRQVHAIDRAAAELGLAFQIVDDILDVEGASADLGKTPGKDAAANKATYPALYGLEGSKARAREVLAEALAAVDRFGDAAEWLKKIACFAVERQK